MPDVLWSSNTTKSATSPGMGQAEAARVDIWNQGLKNAIDVYDYFRRFPLMLMKFLRVIIQY
jgi:hypothetical protein